MIFPGIVFIVGPTAVGKTEVALRVARKLNGEIISCDSMQVYKEAAVVTGKPSAAQRKSVKHHLVDAVAVKEDFDVAEFSRRAIKAVAQVHRRKKLPVVVGGSGLYAAVLLDGIFKSGASKEKRRRELNAQCRKHGTTSLYERLQTLDPAAAGKIHPNDSRRIIRALEVGMAGKPISELQKKRQGLWGKYDIVVFGLTMDRQELYGRIDGRVEEMFRRKAVEEIRKLRTMPLSRSASQIIGFKEIGGYLDGAYDLERAKYLMKRNTRHFAKRQWTWFRRDKRIQWIEIKKDETAGDIADRLIRILNLKRNRNDG